MKTQTPIGLITAAGFATRLGQTSSSKEVLAVADIAASDHAYCPVSHYLLRHYKAAAIERVVVVTRSEKKDIAETLGHNFGPVNIQYQLVEPTASVVHTIDSAYPAIADANIAFGFPDIIVNADSIYSQLFEQLNTGKASAVLGLFPCFKPEKFDMVSTDENNTVQRIDIKNADNLWSETWVCAVWAADFTQFLHQWVAQLDSDTDAHLGQCFQAAIDSGMTLSSVRFPLGQVLDIGTPEDLKVARDPVALKRFFQH